MLKKRIFSGLSLATVMIISFFWASDAGIFIFVTACGFWLIGGLNEFFSMTKAIGYKGYPKLASATGLLMLIATVISALYCTPIISLHLENFIIALFILTGFLRIFGKDDLKDGFIQHMISIAGLIYICWSLNFLPKIYFIEGLQMNGRYLTFFLVLVTKISDVGAFAAGTITSKSSRGNHKMLPRLSPKKSWEGFVGGLVASSITAVILVVSMGDALYINAEQVISVPTAIILGCTFASLGFIGDIAESILKRSSKFKDSGTFFPGLGGFLDVLDSLILVAPLFYSYLAIVSHL